MNNYQRKVLVTGGGGFLGSAIVRLLLENGASVRTLCRREYAHLNALPVEQIRGDIQEPDVVSRACEDCDTVFHVAAKAGVWGGYHTYHGPNVVGTRNVIAACREHDVRVLVHTSSPSVVFDHHDMAGVDESAPYPRRYSTAYPRTKALAEQAVRQAAHQDLPAIVLRPHLIWGPGDNHLVPRIIARAKRLRQVGDGKNLVDTIYIDNAAEAHLMAARCLENNPRLSGRVYFLSQGQPIPLWEMINRILAAAAMPPVKKTISRRGAWLLGALLEGLYILLNITSEPPMTRFVATELATSHWFDIGAARKDLGYVPRVSTEEGLRRLSVWLRDAQQD